ncbi:MAG TPA: AI-2E family transporter [Thermoanaerobaculia bacterium]|nr:AI-2E family transporter [Thermoanaerobaculia bacterium]
MDVLRAAALVIGLYLTLRLLWLVYPILLVAFLGMLFGLAVARGADWLERFRIPRSIGSTLIVLGVLGLLAGLGTWIAPTLREQTRELRSTLPQAISRAEDWLNRRAGGLMGQIMPEQPADQQQPAAPQQAPAPPPKPDAQRQRGNPLGGLQGSLSGQLDAVGRYLFSFLSSTIAVLSGLILIIFMSIYIGSAPALYHKGLLHLFPHRVRPRAREVLGAVGITLRKWLMTQLVAMVVIGVVTTIVLKLLGVKAALPLGIIAGLLEFIPMVGPLLSAIPAVAMGFVDSPEKALFVALAYTGIQFFENHLLIPLLMKEGVDLPPVLTLLGLAVMGVVFGFLGMLVAVPLLAAIVVAVKLLYVEDVVGDDVQTVLDA